MESSEDGGRWGTKRRYQSYLGLTAGAVLSQIGLWLFMPFDHPSPGGSMAIVAGNLVAIAAIESYFRFAKR
jgi:hypothetical protein